MIRHASSTRSPPTATSTMDVQQRIGKISTARTKLIGRFVLRFKISLAFLTRKMDARLILRTSAQSIS